VRQPRGAVLGMMVQTIALSTMSIKPRRFGAVACGVDPAGDGIDTPPSPVGPCLFMQPVRCCEPSLRGRSVARSPFTRRPHPVTRRLSQATLVSLRIVSAAILIKVQRIIPSATGRCRFAWHLAGTISRGSARPIMSCSTAACLKANWGGMGPDVGYFFPGRL
jgi:hypothetical protein